jgi:hypothetical protein
LHVFRPKDLARGNRKVIDNAMKDFTPDTKDNATSLLDSGKGEEKESEERVKKIMAMMIHTEIQLCLMVL